MGPSPPPIFARGSDVFELVDTLTARLGARLSGAPPPPELARISHLGTRNLEAWAAFHRGNALARAGRTEEAEAHFDRAAEIDTAFALPLFALREDAEAARADGRERRTIQLYRRLPEGVRAQLEGLSGEELRATLDSLTGHTRSAIRLLFGERPPGPGPAATPREER